MPHVLVPSGGRQRAHRTPLVNWTVRGVEPFLTWPHPTRRCEDGVLRPEGILLHPGGLPVLPPILRLSTHTRVANLRLLHYDRALSDALMGQTVSHYRILEKVGWERDGPARPGGIAGLSKMSVGRFFILRYRNGYRQGGEKGWHAHIRLSKKSDFEEDL